MEKQDWGSSRLFTGPLASVLVPLVLQIQYREDGLRDTKAVLVALLSEMKVRWLGQSRALP